jgi:3'-phosphoadenosine 5'-phosphosulfate sulfotransferase (PAPS reductase)/FAD synthetase
MTMHVISSSYGNDSVALIRWAYEQSLPNVHVVYMDTGWSSPSWPMRVIKMRGLAESYGFKTTCAESIGMEALVRIKKGFPGNAQQFCTAHLKGLPFLEWIDHADSHCEAVVLIGKRRAESPKRKDTPEFIESSEHHGGRKVWHPLYAHTDSDRNALLQRAGVEPLPHRSLECNPCVNANRADIMRLTPGEVERVNQLEVEIGKPMYRPKRFGALGIYGVIAWAKDGRDRGDIDAETSACSDLFGCGT